MELEFLKALVLVFGVSALSVFLLHRLRVPSLVGFIIAGVLIGPSGLGVMQDVSEIEVLADIGVILLLFVVGVEFSLKGLLRRRKAVLLGGGGQVAFTIALSAAVAYPFAAGVKSAVFLGFLVALSSTAIVLKMLLERGEMDSPHGRMMTGVLIFQDLCVVPLMLLVPALSGEGMDAAAVALTMLKAALIIGALLVLSRWAVPGFLHQVVHTRSRELFIITIIVMCLGIALLTSRLGLSLALGAFLAGLAVSESEYAFQATAEMLPLKDSFMGLFFVSIGMLIDTQYIALNWPAILFAVAVIFVLKTLAAAGPLLFISPPRTAIQSAVGLAQIGEFSFVLAEAGRQVGLMSQGFFQLFLSASVATMALTPFLLRASSPVSLRLASLRLFKGLERPDREEAPSGRMSGHVLIVGFGVNGKNLARTLRVTGVPYAVLELNSDTVREEKGKGEPIYYGDGSSAEILHRLGLEKARILVVAISDPASTRKTVATARRMNPSLYIIVRTRYLAEVEDLRALGADEVIPEEFETSVEIFSRVLSQFGIPRNVIADRIDDIRKDSYRSFRTHELPRRFVGEGHAMLSGIETETYLVRKSSHLAGHSLGGIQLRTRTGATAMAVKRGEELHQNPGPDFVLGGDDIVLLVGRREDINRAVEYLESEAFLTWRYHT
jgi:CPA2 family monovalent cation:H+ antiporter-2